MLHARTHTKRIVGDALWIELKEHSLPRESRRIASNRVELRLHRARSQKRRNEARVASTWLAASRSTAGSDIWCLARHHGHSRATLQVQASNDCSHDALCVPIPQSKGATTTQPLQLHPSSLSHYCSLPRHELRVNSNLRSGLDTCSGGNKAQTRVGGNGANVECVTLPGTTRTV